MRPNPAALAIVAVLSVPAAARAETTVPTIAYELDLSDEALLLVGIYPDRAGALRQPQPAVVDTPEESPRIEYELVVTVMSDLRRGGTSLSNGKPASQVEFAIEHPSGLYASLWGARVADNGGSDIEINLGTGYAFQLGSFDAGVGVIGYLYPGVPGSSYYELQAGLARQFGPVELAAVLAYSPRQANLGDRDNIYAGLEFNLPVAATPLSFNGALGLEDGAAGNKKVDWQLGATYDLKVLSLGIDYIDGTHAAGAPHSDATVVVSAQRVFR